MKNTQLGILLICMLLSSCSQNKIFIRIYDNRGSKIEKGYLESVTDTSVVVLNKQNVREIPYHKIGSLKTNRSMGHTMLTSGLIIAGATTVVGLAILSVDPLKNTGAFKDLSYTNAELIGTGIVAGITGGAAIGGVSSATRDLKKYTILEKKGNWKPVKRELDLQLSMKYNRKKENWLKTIFSNF